MWQVKARLWWRWWRRMMKTRRCIWHYEWLIVSDARRARARASHLFLAFSPRVSAVHFNKNSKLRLFHILCLDDVIEICLQGDMNFILILSVQYAVQMKRNREKRLLQCWDLNIRGSSHEAKRIKNPAALPLCAIPGEEDSWIVDFCTWLWRAPTPPLASINAFSMFDPLQLRSSTSTVYDRPHS